MWLLQSQTYKQLSMALSAIPRGSWNLAIDPSPFANPLLEPARVVTFFAMIRSAIGALTDAEVDVEVIVDADLLLLLLSWFCCLFSVVLEDGSEAGDGSGNVDLIGGDGCNL